MPDRAQDLVESLGARGMTLRFEDLLADPNLAAERLAEFCGVEPADVSGIVEGSRAYAFREDRELVALSREYAAKLRAAGYGPEGRASEGLRSVSRA